MVGWLPRWTGCGSSSRSGPLYARPNPKYFGRKRGITWLNMINDQAAGLAAKVLSGTPRDSLHAVDVVLRQQGGVAPEAIITDTGSYSDFVFGMLLLLGRQYRPQLANLPDQRLWRIDPAADYGPLDRAARGRIDVDRITQHWEDMCRVAVSIHSGEVSAHEVTRMISRDGNPTSLGQAIAHYGRIFKTLHILRLADDEPYRREIKSQANLTEGRHDLARRVFHGKKGEVTKAYYDGMEDQLSALGLVLNCIVLWNTVYMDRAWPSCAPRAIRCLSRTCHGYRRSCATTSASTGTTAFTYPTSAAATVRCVTRTPKTTHKACRWPAGIGRCTGRSAGPAISARSFPSTMGTPTSTSRVCPTRTRPLDRPRPIRPDERPGVSGFTDQKSSATSSVLVAPRHPRKV